MSGPHETIGVLLVDDQPGALLALESILERPGIELETATSGEAALRHLLRRDFAVIVLDVRMPGMDGFELATLIRRRERSASTPILFLTGVDSDVAAMCRAYSVGAVDYLLKPVDPDILTAKVTVFVELFDKDRRLQEQARALLNAERRNRELEVERLRLASERRYRNLAEAIPQIVWTADPWGQPTFFNHRWSERTGLAGEGPSMTSWLEAVHPSEREHCQVAWDEALASGRPFEIECRLRSREGHYRWHLCRAFPETEASGNTVGWLGTHTDLDELFRARAQAEAARRRSELLAAASAALSTLDYEQSTRELVRLAVPSLADGCAVSVLDPSADAGGCAEVRQAWHVEPAHAVLLLRLLERLATPMARLHPRGELVADVTGGWLASLADDAGELEQLAGLRLRSAMRVPVLARGRALGALLFVTDRSERRLDADDLATAGDLARRTGVAIDNALLYRRAEDAIQLRDEFLSVAAHELRTPLSALLLQLSSLEHAWEHRASRPGSTAKITRKITVAVGQTRRLTSLVDELLDVSRLSKQQRVMLEYEDMDLSSLAREIGERFSEQALQAGCELSVQAPRPLTGRWDRLRLEQVLTNLVSNAIKYGSGQPVELHVERVEAGARITVHDRGIGIAGEDRERIFERFERAVSARNECGLGLGLYIAKRIVEAHQGRIHVMSEPGSGSTFIIDLPTAELPDREGRSNDAREGRP